MGMGESRTSKMSAFTAVIVLLFVTFVLCEKRSAISSREPMMAAAPAKRAPIEGAMYCFNDISAEGHWVEWAADDVETQAFDMNTYYTGKYFVGPDPVGLIYGHKRPNRRWITLNSDQFEGDAELGHMGGISTWFFMYEADKMKYKRAFKFSGLTSSAGITEPTFEDYTPTLLEPREGCFGGMMM